MKVLQVGNIDTYGNKFNGAELSKKLRNRGINSEFCVWEKYIDDKYVWPISNFRGKQLLNQKISNLEKRLSIQSLFYMNSLTLPFTKRFRNSDIIHYHLIHTGYFSIATLPLLTHLKPSIWTLHDPWAMTGHCIYPYDCERWKIGCGNCLHLKTPIPMNKDNTALMWKIKKKLYQWSKIDIIVASKWMLNMARSSPLISKFRLHYIPFGLNSNLYRPTNTTKAKRSLGISPNDFVISFRVTNNEFKGLPYIKAVLKKLKTTRKVCLITFQEKGLLAEFKKKYQIIELGWVSDDEKMVTAYNASDIFLMPSTMEAFGMMAIEAMLCAKPVITFSGTSLPEVIFAPKGGISVPMGDFDALIKEIVKLMNNPKEQKKLGNNARQIACQYYDENKYLNRMIRLYYDVIKERQK